MFIKYALIAFFVFTSPLLSADQLVNLTTSDVDSKLTQHALVIDIRTPQEWKSTGIIPGSHPVKFFDQNGKYD
ncbi:MAG: hypothetical protein DRQ62_07725, partial [Gammaproteobacteria bacterium]